MSFDIEKQKLQEIFQAFDKNGDGQLDYQELVEGYTHYFNGDVERAEIEANQIMGKLDFNGNGSIDYSEFIIAHMDITKLFQEDKLREVFDMFDQDHSGSITADEIKKILGKGMDPANEVEDAEWDKILEEVDVNGDGEISFEEFKDMINRMNVAHSDECEVLNPQAVDPEK